MTNKKWSKPKGKKLVTVKPHTRRVDVQDDWGRFAYTKNIKVKGYLREKRKPKRKINPIVMKKVIESTR